MTEEANDVAVNYANNETQQATTSGVDGGAELKTGPTTPQHRQQTGAVDTGQWESGLWKSWKPLRVR